MRRWFKECNKGKTAFMAVFDELHAADIVAHGGTGEEVRGLKNFKEYCLEWLNAFPDLHFTIYDMVVEGDKVAVRSSWTGTFRRELKGIPPTNKKVTSWEIEIDRIANEKIVEIWTRYDTSSVMQQVGLGTIPNEKR
jgi:predicted ester cyclase